MTFKQVRTVSKAVLFAALAGYLVAAVLMYCEMDMAEPVLYVSTALMVAAVVMRFIWGKCPHCNNHISRKHFADKKCPYCGKDLML